MVLCVALVLGTSACIATGPKRHGMVAFNAGIAGLGAALMTSDGCDAEAFCIDPAPLIGGVMLAVGLLGAVCTALAAEDEGGDKKKKPVPY
jgi:hypothetical protein